MITIKRVYDPRSDDDGYRILIDRLWPRGLSKENARVDLWMKEIAPSTALRKWFHHDTGKWEEFNDLYRKELANKKKKLAEIGILEKKHNKVTLLYSARDTTHNQAVVLLQVLQSL